MLTCFSRAAFIILIAFILFLARAVLSSSSSSRGTAAYRHNVVNWCRHSIKTCVHQSKNGLTLNKNKLEKNVTISKTAVAWTRSCGRHGNRGTATCEFGLRNPRDDPDKLRINAGRFKSRSLLAQWSRGDNDPVSAAPAGPWGNALYALIGHLTEATLGWGHQALAARLRDPQHTLPQIQPSTVGLIFQKCAQVETGSEVPRVRFYLVIKNPPDGTDLLRLRICDAISDITLLQTSGTVQERGYQMFTTDSLPAGSNYVETYTANVKGSRNEVLSLPALLSFSKNSENDISLFDPVVANFTLRLNATEKVYAHHVLHFAGFSGGFLASTLLFSLMLFITSCLYNKWHKLSSHHRRKRGFSRGMELEEDASNIIESANEDAPFEDKIIDIMALEDPQNVFQALDNLEMSTLLREAVAVEGIRVQLVKGVFGVLLGGVGVAGRHVFTVLLGQVVGMEGKLQEEQEARLATLAAQCTMETRREMEALHHTHTTEKTHAERLQCAQQQVLECMVLLERLQKKEQKWLQRALQTKHELASAQAQRHTALRRRAELHAIFSEELQEAASAGEMEEDMANHLLHCYYTCQDQLEDVLDFFVANRRAVLNERHAHRKFLLKGLHGQQRLLWDMFRASSQHMDSWFTEIRREGGLCDEQCSHQLEHAQLDLLQVKQSLEDTLNRERSSMHCDIIKKRRASILDMLREHKREQRELVCVWGGRVDEYLLRWQTILSAHSTQLSELIMHLDQEAAAEIHKLLLRVQQEAVVELKAVAGAVAQALQTLGVPRWLLHSEVGAEGVAEAQERLHAQRKVWAGSLRASRSSTQQCRQMELQQQTALRERLRQYCRCMCMSQPAMSERDLLRARLECAKRMCCLDCGLVLPHALSRARQYTSFTGPITQSCQSDPRTDVSDDADTGNTSLTLKETKNALISGENFMEAGLCAGDKDPVSFIRSVEKRINLHQQERRRNMSMEETYMCEDQEQKVYLCEQDVAKAVVALQWERGERRSRVLETHSALLELQSLLLQHLRHTPAEQELTNTIHAQSLALEEAELQLQKEEAEWKALAYECSSTKLLIVADGIDAQFFRVDKVSRIALRLQEALCKRQQLTQTLTERLMEEISRQQAIEDLRDQLELKPLYTHCDQDLALTAVLVKLSGVSVRVLQEILRLLLPTLPEGELQSLVDALSPKAGQTLEPCTELVDRLKKDIIRRNLSSWSHQTEKQLGRNLRKKQTFLDRLFSISPEGSKSLLKVQDQTRKQKPVPFSDAAKEEAPSGPGGGTGGAKAETWYKESIPAEDMGVAIESPVSGERLFLFRCSPPGDQENTHSLPPLLKSECNHKKRRSFLKFKKGTVAPQEQMQEKEEEQTLKDG